MDPRWCKHSPRVENESARRPALHGCKCALVKGVPDRSYLHKVTYGDMAINKVQWPVVTKVFWIMLQKASDTRYYQKAIYFPQQDRMTYSNKGVFDHIAQESGYELDMSTGLQRLKSPRSLSGTSAHPTMVTLVYIIVMNGWLTSFSFHVNRRPHSWDKAISDPDLATPRSRWWVGSKGKVNQSAQYHIISLPFHFTSARPTIPEIQLSRNVTLKHPR